MHMAHNPSGRLSKSVWEGDIMWKTIIKKPALSIDIIPKKHEATFSSFKFLFPCSYSWD